MFGKGAEVVRGDHRGHSILQDGVTIKGELQATGDVRLDGRLEGKIVVTERLTVGEGGSLAADIEAGEVVVMGSVHGNIKANKRLEIKKGAVVVGDIATPILIIEEGVRFQGHADMNVDAEKAILQLPNPPARDSRPTKSENMVGVDV